MGHAEQRVGGDVEPHMLHGDERPRAGEGRADADFQGHLFIGRPLGVAAQLGEGFQNFRRRGAGITGPQPHARMQRRQRDGAVAA